MSLKWNLTSEQQDAANKFFSFLISKEKEFYLFGSAGCGKTYLTQFFITELFQQYKDSCKLFGIKQDLREIMITATTNKAVEVLAQGLKRPDVDTVFAGFNVVVAEDFKTGETYLRERNREMIYSTLVVVDECSMLSSKMLEIIRKRLHSTSKILFVGDSHQLAPVNEEPYWDNLPEDRTVRLTTPVRNKNNQALVNLCSQLRITVETKEFKPISLIPGSVELLDDTKAKEWLNNFNPNNQKILCFTNDLVTKYIEYVANAKGKSSTVQLGSYYINNSNCLDRSKSTNEGGPHLFAEELVKVTSLSSPTKCISKQGREFTVRVARVSSVNCDKTMDVFIPVNQKEIKMHLQDSKNSKQWIDYFFFKNNIADLRLPYASTVHKSQGNTYDEVLIDLDSFKSCWDPDVAARLLYVAVSRARNRVLFHGSLPKRFGELV